MVEVPVGSRSRLLLWGSRLVLDSVFGHVLGLLLVLVPFVRGWRVVVLASRSADSTSVGLSYGSAIAQTRGRNCLSAIRGMGRRGTCRSCRWMLRAATWWKHMSTGRVFQRTLVGYRCGF